MRYMLMICDDESDQRATSDIVGDPQHVAWIDYLDDHRVTLITGARLRPSGDATTVQLRDGRTLISDGPFVETKELICGFAMIECADLDDAIEAAARHPFAAHGLIEIRPVWDE